FFFFFSSRRRHTRFSRDWSSDVCSSDLKILFYAASRGHHADIGGTAPGSMTPLATTVDEEGVLFDNFRLVERGRFREADLHRLRSEERRVGKECRSRWAE